MSRLVKIDFMAALVGRGLEHVAEEILLMIKEPPDLSNLQLVSKSVLSRFLILVGIFSSSKVAPGRPYHSCPWTDLANILVDF